MATPTQDAAPEVPILACTTCEAPPLTGVPAPFVMGAGRVTEGDPVGPGCKTFIVNCDAATMMRAVVIGANMENIQLSEPSAGAKMATLVCNADGELEGRTVDGDPLT
uniref:Uncharacterized protein n=1 Tax=Panagrolaimus sp. PS1159 TaxID=55785 RepID=A0AC35FN09_9BILA